VILPHDIGTVTCNRFSHWDDNFTSRACDRRWTSPIIPWHSLLSSVFLYDLGQLIPIWFAGATSTTEYLIWILARKVVGWWCQHAQVLTSTPDISGNDLYRSAPVQSVHHCQNSRVLVVWCRLINLCCLVRSCTHPNDLWIIITCDSHSSVRVYVFSVTHFPPRESQAQSSWSRVGQAIIIHMALPVHNVGCIRM
jgi:hypothetical protein